MPTLAQRPNWRARRGGAFQVPQAELLVDELATGLDSELASHADVLWYPSNDSLGAMLPNDWWCNQSSNAEAGATPRAGPGAEIVAVAEYGMNAVRFSSPYDPDHWINNGTGAYQTFNSSNPAQNDGFTIQSWRKWINSNTIEVSSPATAVQTGPLHEAYLRWMLMKEADTVTYHTEPNGFKLSGFEDGGTGSMGCGGILAHRSPGEFGAAANQFALSHYWAGLPDNAEDDQTPLKNSEGYVSGTNTYLDVDVWHCIELHVKQNSASDVFDGIIEVWLDDVLILQRLNIRTWTGAGGLVEINQVRGQLFHGGQSFAPSGPMHHKQFGYCLATRRIGAAKLV